MVESAGLENRCGLRATVGSNPTPSAKLRPAKKQRDFVWRAKQDVQGVQVFLGRLKRLSDKEMYRLPTKENLNLSNLIFSFVFLRHAQSVSKLVCIRVGEPSQ